MPALLSNLAAARFVPLLNSFSDWLTALLCFTSKYFFCWWRLSLVRKCRQECRHGSLYCIQVVIYTELIKACLCCFFNSRGRGVHPLVAVNLFVTSLVCLCHAQVIIGVTEMLHNASLLIDDIEDSSKLRRGFPVAHSIYGIPSVINSANYVYFLGLEKVLTLEHPEAVQVFTRQLLELHRGQGLDIHWRDTYTCPTEQEYRNMVLQKTGGLFGLAVGLMQLFSNWKQDLKPLLDTLGLFFQIRDDYANLSSREYSENKSFCEDLTEGKFSFPTIHAIWSRPESTQVQNILRQRTENMDIKRYCVDYLEKVGSFAYTRQTLRDLEVEAYRLIREFGGNPQLESLVRHLSQMHQEAEAAAQSSTKPHSSRNHWPRPPFAATTHTSLPHSTNTGTFLIHRCASFNHLPKKLNSHFTFSRS